jgi:hypothetical protein
MANSDVRPILALVPACASAALFLAFCGKVAWRNRRNQFLFFGWLGVLVVFILMDFVVYSLYLTSGK